jgi:hypothetical protein
VTYSHDNWYEKREQGKGLYAFIIFQEKHKWIEGTFLKKQVFLDWA